ncbi:MAG: hypothetical protein DMG65_16890 [Candidatus Angelobacter sp. Gp1-AA117]|nr:MAG: hypothetical protein DMG65_16890 [Candidatus Angelobacter sp. Gp1-AA117]
MGLLLQFSTFVSVPPARPAWGTGEALLLVRLKLLGERAIISEKFSQVRGQKLTGEREEARLVRYSRRQAAGN